MDDLLALYEQAPRDDLAVVITRDHPYWALEGSCTLIPLIAPGVAGAPMLDGLPTTDCALANVGYGYGYWLYGLSAQPPDPRSDEAYCQRAARDDLSRVALFTPEGMRIIRCG